MRPAIAILALALTGGASCAQKQNQVIPQKQAEPAVTTGLVAFMQHPPTFVRGKRIGLITNHSGRDEQGRSTVDLLNGMKGVKLVALFAPQHGIRGTADTSVASTMDEKTGLPIHSLFGATFKPTPEMLNDVDVLIYDILDIGVRQYTFESTMALGMEAAAQKGIPFIVLDRPNPITGTIVEGNLTDPKLLSFVGIYPVASRHGMTMGELAKMYNAEQKIGADLTVIPMAGWRRRMWWEQTGLSWVNPSPNIRRVEAEVIYPGSVFFEGVNVSEGRGSSLPLEQVGAPWLKNAEIANAMNAMRLPGVRFDAVEFLIDSTGQKYAGQTVKGIRFVVTDRNTFRPIRSALLLMDQIKRTHPNEFQWATSRETTVELAREALGANRSAASVLRIDRLTGSDQVRKAIDGGTLPAMLRQWDADAAKFTASRKPYLLYD
jgi:uncharacterized protein YbbC (DUF1343 family)